MEAGIVSILQAILLGAAQGLTEFLPVSSSGHLSVLQHFFQVRENALLFDVILHLGTLLAVLIVYRKTLAELLGESVQLAVDLARCRLRHEKNNETRRLLFLLALACVPMLLLLVPVGHGRRLLDLGAAVAQDDDVLLEGCCFLLTGFLLLFGARQRKEERPLSCRSALAVGAAQLLAALFPGISRSGSTISAAMLCGVQRRKAVAFSFLLGIPAVLAASALEIADGIRQGAAVDWLPFVCGGITAAVVGVFSIRLIEKLVQKNRFHRFGWYCLAVGAAVVTVSLIEKMHR